MAAETKMYLLLYLRLHGRMSKIRRISNIRLKIRTSESEVSFILCENKLVTWRRFKPVTKANYSHERIDKSSFVNQKIIFTGQYISFVCLK